MDNTLTFTFTVETAGVSGNAWVARSVTGTLKISTPYTRLPSNFYCPAQSLDASLTASA